MRWLIRSALFFVTVALALGVYNFLSFEAARPLVGEAGSVQVQGRRVAYSLSGQGPTVVMLASAGRSASDFNELIAELSAAGYRSLAIEAPGVGESDPISDGEVSLHDLAANVAGVLDAVGPASEIRVFVLGHAFGNRVARAFARNFPERVHATLLLAAGGRVPPEIDIEKAFATIFAAGLPDTVRVPVIQNAFFAGDNPVPDYWKNGWYLSALLVQTRATAQTPVESWWDAGGAPILVLQPGDDILAPPGNAELLRQAFPERVHVVEVSDAGHALLPEQPERVAEHVIEFLDARSRAQPEG